MSELPKELTLKLLSLVLGENVTKVEYIKIGDRGQTIDEARIKNLKIIGTLQTDKELLDV